MILLYTFGPYFFQINVNETDRQRAEKSDVMHFFDCMTSQKYYEKVAKDHYYIFDSNEEYLYYGKLSAGFFKAKIIEIFKVDVNALCKQIPNFKKLHGALLKEIVLSEIAKSNGLCNQSEIIVNTISFKLDTTIVISIDFMINGKARQEIYKLDTDDFSIVN
jgi:hypothetical protein